MCCLVVVAAADVSVYACYYADGMFHSGSTVGATVMVVMGVGVDDVMGLVEAADVVGVGYILPVCAVVGDDDCLLLLH